jgi:hypothetical protein
MNQKNFSGINDEEFHKEGTREMLLGLNYHLEETRSKIPVDANVLPTCFHFFFFFCSWFLPSRERWRGRDESGRVGK